MNRRLAALALAATALVGATALTGCSSTSSTSETTAAATTAAAEEGGAQMLPPVIITEDQTEATAKVGDFLDIITPEDKLAGTTVSTENKDLVELVQGGEDGEAFFNPGGKVLAPGTAVIVVTSPDSSTRTITLTITE